MRGRTSPASRSRVGLALLAFPLLAACEDAKEAKPPVAQENRSNAVLAAAGAEKAAARPAPSVSAPPAAPKAPRKLCEGTSLGKASPRGAVEKRSTAGASPLPSAIPFGAGKFVWVNLWAAWCGPCKEEIPRLLGFRDRLRSEGVSLELAFVSLDDDERQLDRLLEQQPATGVRASYWLPEGGTRSSFLGALGVKESPELPFHAVYGPDGKLLCSVQGAIEDGDYPALASLFGAKR